ncbi:helix-turn-helix domain-containing protein [Sulfurimonas sp.]|jgi:predicted DNA-binding transcriptional regulator AlpA|uniref:helix-turn-helix transcriptional regulator n=1 Tax=Sulfurimonas sp. TaxID=2022749 RepID=UPI0025CCB07D|nr:helix-turn-helix domain-containing protein [Sulfurimonas sp.]
MCNTSNSGMKQKRYYRAKELAELLGIGLSTVWLYAKEGKLKPKKISQRVTVFDIDDVNQLFIDVEMSYS